MFMMRTNCDGDILHHAPWIHSSVIPMPDIGPTDAVRGRVSINQSHPKPPHTTIARRRESCEDQYRMKLCPNHVRLIYVALFALGAAERAAAEAPAAIFENRCAACHGLDGKARTPAGRKAGAKDLSESRLSDADIERQIREGSKDKRRTAKMPAFADKLTAEEIKALVTYVKSFRSH